MKTERSTGTNRNINSIALWLLLAGCLMFLQYCQKEDAPPLTGIDLQLVAEDLVSPIQVASTDNSERIYIVDQIGKVWLIDGNVYNGWMADIHLKLKRTYLSLHFLHNKYTALKNIYLFRLTMHS